MKVKFDKSSELQKWNIYCSYIINLYGRHHYDTFLLWTYITLHYITLHYITLHYITLHMYVMFTSWSYTFDLVKFDFDLLQILFSLTIMEYIFESEIWQIFRSTKTKYLLFLHNKCLSLAPLSWYQFVINNLKKVVYI